MPNFCPECGKKIEGTPKFCNECGHLLQGTVTSSEVKKEGPKYPWLFTGALAKYYGTATFADVRVSMELFGQLQVTQIDQINNRVKIQSTTRMAQRQEGVKIGFGHTRGRERDTGDRKMEDWLRIGDRMIFEDGAVLENESKGVLSVNKLGRRKCIIEQYKVGNNTEIVFWDEEFCWPIQYIMIFLGKGRQNPDYLKSISHMLTGDFGKSWDDASIKTVIMERSIVINMTESNIPWGLS